MASLTSTIDIIGYASRLPGAKNAADFWSLLDQGKCAVTSVDPERWALSRFGHPDRNVPGKSYTWAAGQIDDVWGFDPSFFGISPREAIQMDPQQRLLLQLVWEALEHANVKPGDLAGTNTGVYVGASSLDYHHRFLIDPSNSDTQFMTGNTLSIVSNRVSYIYDLRGPSFTVDTACSSSLVALHEAVSALESGQIDTAVICGVSLLLSPFAFVGFSRATMLSQTGLCQAFDAKGDGYVRSEGGVVMVLRARRAGKLKGTRSHAQLIATGINADGRTVGMSLPSAYAQAGLLREIYWDMGIDPEALAFVEAHGTGTRVGDPAEAEALGTVIGQKRSAPLHIGSVKTNVGHLEPVSGLVGLLKAVMALENNKLPKSLHFETPNPDIPFEDLNLKVASEAVSLAPSDKPRLAGVNSFGFGGTNAHAVIADPEEATAAAAAAPLDAPLVISARSKGALKELAQAYAEKLKGAEEAEAGSIIASAAHGRDLLSERLVVTGKTAEEKSGALAAFALDETSPLIVTGDALRPAEKIGFVFSGNGAQWAGMGQEAYQADEAFRLAFEQVDRIFMGLGGWSLLTTLFAEDLENDIERTEIAQPLLFAIQVALVSSLKSRGIEPDGVAGHSVGEVAAAWCAGALTLEQAVKVIHARSTEQEVVRDLGSMGALLLPVEQARAAIAKSGLPRLEVAAVNSPRSVTISGDAESLDAFAKFARKNKWAMRRLNLAYPFHSALVDPIRDPLLKALEGVVPSQPSIPFHSTVDVDGTVTPLDADYWWRNVRQPVLFSAAIDAMVEAGNGVLVEIGPKPVLGTYLNDILRASGKKAKVLSSLDQPAKGASGSQGNPVDRIAAQILANGGRTDLDRFVAPAPAQLAHLPLYPWQNTTFKIEPTGELVDYIVGSTWPLLGYRLRQDAAEWFNHLDPASLPWLADHKVEESIVFPAAGYTEMALRAALCWSKSDAIELRDMDILRPLVFEDGDVWETLVRISPDDKVLEILSRPRLQDGEFGLNARGHFVSVGNSSRTPWLDAGTDSLSVLEHDALYEITKEFGLDYGQAFARVEKVVTHDQRNATVYLRPQAEAVTGAELSLCPTLVDSGFHGLFALLKSVEGIPEKTSFLPIRIGSVRLLRSGTPPAEVRIRVTKASPRSIEATFEYLDSNGQVVARLSQARFRAVKLGRDTRPDELVYRQFAALLPESGRTAPVEKTLGGSFAAFAEQAGVGCGTPPELGDAAILLEALGRSITHTSLYGLSESGKLSPAGLTSSGKLEQSAKPLFYALLSWLQDNGLAQEESGVWTLSDPADGPSPADLMQAIAVEAPRHVAEAALLARLDTDLAELLANGLKSTSQEAFASGLYEAYRTASPSASALSDALRELGCQLVSSWPAQDPLKVLIVGASASGLSHDIDAKLDPRRMQAVITDPSDALIGRAERLWTGSTATSFLDFTSDELDKAAPFDVILCGASLAELTSEQLARLKRLAVRGGLLVAAEALPSPLTNLLRGTGSDWWSQSAAEEFPLSLQDADWTKALEAAGFEGIESLALDSDELEADLFAARAPATEAASETAPGSDEDEKQEHQKTFLLLADQAGNGRKLADGLASCLEAAGARVIKATAGEETAKAADGSWTVSPDGNPDALKALLGESGYRIVHLLGAYDGAADALAAADLRTWSLTQLLNTIGADDAELAIVAPGGAQSLANGSSNNPAQAAVWGYGRVAMNEFPNAGVRLIDVSADLEPGLAAARLADELLVQSVEREVILDGSRRSGLRIFQGGTLPENTLPEGTRPAMRLDILRQGSLDQLAWHAVARKEPEGSEVEIAVEASGLNFRDVMWALGLLPEEALEDGFAGPTLGMECCGTVTAVGEKVTRFRPGDKVITFAPACFASHVSVDESGCAPMPSSVSSEEAATIPVTFLTAYYALVHLAKLSEGETVLIHGGAGGVGLAALQIAKWRGAKVIATAGSREKRNFLKLLGADVVLDSRSLEFVDAVMADTKGDGVDVVLNSLFGEAMERSIEVLKPFGRFLELGKRDYYGNTRIGLRPFRQNLTYFGIDADQLLTRQPALAESLFRDLVELFENHTLTPLPYRVFEADRVVDAFRLMQQAGHIGKIVLRPPVVPQSVPAERKLELNSDGTYVIAGGFGGFGVELLKRLGSLGARNLAVLSRRGDASDEAKAAIAALAAQGVTVRAFACDITDEAAVQASLESIRTDLPAIRGVFHTAMVLNDVLIANLKHDGLSKVLAPKIRGAELLDRLTRQDPVEHFVLYSSATTLVGNPGQANYVAANGYLEALSRKRRSEGLPALTVAWGAISDAGYLARNEDVNEMLSRKLGRHALSASEALDGLTSLMSLPDQSDLETAALGYARIDWQSARRDLALLATPLVSYLGLGDSEDGGAADGAIDLAALLEGMDKVTAAQTVAKLLAAEIGKILRISPEEIDPHKPLSEIGMDSLMALELRMGAERQLGIDIPLMSLANGATLIDLSTRVANRVLGEAGDDGVSAESRTLASQHVNEAGETVDGLTDIAEKVESKSRELGSFL